MTNNNQQQEPAKYLFAIDGDGDISPHLAQQSKAVHEIPPGVYTLVFRPSTPMSGMQMYLRPEKNFRIPDRLYGDVNLSVDRYLRSYERNDKNLGTLFVGEQGSGKTMQLKALAVKATELGYPVILIDEEIPGSALNWFLSTIVQPTLVCFDEFEKSYDTMDKQRGILQLLDGTNTGAKKMYCFSANDISKISPHMLNRPSRVRYVRTFRRLELSAVVDYVQSNLKNCTEDHIRAFIHLALADGVNEERTNSSNGMNFDMMTEYVREMNQFGGSLNETLEVMGLKGTKSWSRFEVNGFVSGEKLYHAMAYGDHIGAYAASDDWRINFSIHTQKLKDKKSEDEVDSWKWEYDKVELTQRDFKGFGDSHDSLIFEKDGVEYHARYIDFGSSKKLKNSVEEADAGKSQQLQPGSLQLRVLGVKHRTSMATPSASVTDFTSSAREASPSANSSIQPSCSEAATTNQTANEAKTTENTSSAKTPTEEKPTTGTGPTLGKDSFTMSLVTNLDPTTMTKTEKPSDTAPDIEILGVRLKQSGDGKDRKFDNDWREGHDPNAKPE